MRREEIRWCLWYALVLALVTTLPYMLAFGAQGESWRFSGFLFAVEDGNSYLAKMMQGASGAWLFRTPYTTYPQRGVVAMLPYLLLGKLAAGEAMHEQLVTLYHLLRVLAIPLAVLASYRFIGMFVAETKWRRWATLLATAGGGLGWLSLILPGGTLLGTPPLEFYSPETFGFLGIYGIPHLVLARAIMLYALTLYLQGNDKAWKAGALLALLALVQPLTVLVAYAVIAAHMLALAGAAWRDRMREKLEPWIRSGAKVLLISFPLVAYFAWRFTSDPFLRLWTQQNVITSPHPLHYLLAYGALLPPAIVGGRMLLRGRGMQGLLPIAWVILVPALAYAPHNLQRRLPEGVWVALVALAALGLSVQKGRAQRVWALLLLAVSLLSSLMLVGGGMTLALAPRQPVFVPAEQAQVYEELAGQARLGEVVLASYPTANELPAWAPVRVIAGHGPESVNLEQVQPRVREFYRASTSEEVRQTLLEEFAVSYIFWGEHERALGDWMPSDSMLGAPLISIGGCEVFSIARP